MSSETNDLFFFFIEKLNLFSSFFSFIITPNKGIIFQTIMMKKKQLGSKYSNYLNSFWNCHKGRLWDKQISAYRRIVQPRARFKIGSFGLCVVHSFSLGRGMFSVTLLDNLTRNKNLWVVQVTTFWKTNKHRFGHLCMVCHLLSNQCKTFFSSKNLHLSPK